MTEAGQVTCGVCGQPVDPDNMPEPGTFTNVEVSPGVLKPVLDKPFRMDPATGAVCWCPGALLAGGQGVPSGQVQDRRIRGCCPWGCGETLFVGLGGFITCGHLQCPHPDGLSVILSDNEPDHIVEFVSKSRFEILHPMRERLAHKLLACPLAKHLRELERPPVVAAGKYRAAQRPTGTWSWEPLP